MSAESWMLEVRSRWDGTVLQTRHFGEGDDASIGSETGWYWSLCGVGIGWVPRHLAPLLAVSPPLLSDVRAQVKGDFLVSSDEVEGERIIGGNDGTGFTIRVPMAWGVEVLEDYEQVELDALLRSGRARRHGDEIELDIGRDTIAGFSVGPLDFEARLVLREKPTWWGVPDPERNRMGGLGAAALAMLALLSFFFANAPRPTMNVDLLEEPDLRRYVYVNKPEVKEPEPEPEAIVEGAKGPGGAAAKPDMVGSTTPDARTPSGVSSKEQVLQSGILPGLDQVFDSMGGMATLEASLHGLRGITGAGGIGVPGGAGLGGRGGFGGGATEGLGGFGPPGGGKPGFGGGRPNAGKKPTAIFKADTGGRIILGPALDASLIDGVIKRYYRQIKYCYQKQLQRDPSLGGKVTVKFTIAASGSVSKASVAASTMGNATVDTCVVDRFRKMTFPKPKGGGIVVVKYPFVFSPG